MTYMINPTCELPIMVDRRGALCLCSMAFGVWKVTFLAGFGDWLKKQAFFIKKSPQSSLKVPKSVTDLIKSEADLSFSVTDLTKSETDLSFSVTDLTKSETDLSFSMTDLTKSETDLSFSVTDLSKSEMDLTFSVTDLTQSATDLTRSEAISTMLKPDIGDKMAQIVVLKADLITAKAPGTPGTNFISKFVGAEVTRLKAKEVRDSLRRLLHALINFNVSILINGIQGVAYASNNVSASCRSLRSGG
jgi:hypothetical protein